MATGKAAARKTAVTLTHPEKRLWRKDNVTKADLAAYYARMAAPLLRFIGGRPVSIIRAPDGIEAETFFQRHHSRGTSSRIGKVKIPGDRQPYLVVQDADGLAAMAQWGAVELHPWGATARDIDHPDQIIFDLDPDGAVPFRLLKKAAFLMRHRLAALGLPSFAKLTGGKGIHVVVPLKPRIGWKEVKAFAQAIARDFAEDDPANFVAVASKAKRKGRIFIDYLRNDRSATAIACWSPRGRPGAPLAVPVTWDFLKRQTRLPVFTLKKPANALKHLKDWDDFDRSRVVLTKSLLRRAGV